MNAPLKAVQNTGALEATMLQIGRDARAAARTLALAAPARKNRALAAMAAAVRASRAAILAAKPFDNISGSNREPLGQAAYHMTRQSMTRRYTHRNPPEQPGP